MRRLLTLGVLLAVLAGCAERPTARQPEQKPARCAATLDLMGQPRVRCRLPAGHPGPHAALLPRGDVAVVWKAKQPRNGKERR